MKNFSTFKRVMLLMVLVLASGKSFALTTKYVPVYDVLRTYPTGAGKVYATFSGEYELPEGADYSTPKDEMEVKFVYKQSGKVSYYDAHAVPAEGWIAAGFSTEKYVDGEPVLNDSIEKVGDVASLSVATGYDVLTGGQGWDAAADAMAQMPTEPQGGHYALFTRVAPRITDKMQNRLGSVKISKGVNNIGDEVTLTATPKYPEYTTFSHWVEKSTGNQITENPLTFTVTKADEYEAVFNSSLLFDVEFPEEGGYLPFYFDTYTYYTENVEEAVITYDSLKVNGDRVYVQQATLVNAADAKTPVLLYGKGKAQFLSDPESLDASGLSYVLSGKPRLYYSGEEGLKAADAEIMYIVNKDTTYYKDNYIYLFDTEASSFKLSKEENIAAKTVYMAIPKFIISDSLSLSAAPEEIFMTASSQETGIKAVSNGAATVNGKYYTIDGRLVAAPEQNGIYIRNGKKVIYRK